MKVFYALDCDCSLVELRTPGWKPMYFPEENEQIAAGLFHRASEAAKRGTGPLYFAYHVAGRHIIHVI